MAIIDKDPAKWRQNLIAVLKKVEISDEDINEVLNYTGVDQGPILKLALKRVRAAFKRLRAKLEMQREGNEDVNKTYKKRIAEFQAASRVVIKQKEEYTKNDSIPLSVNTFERGWNALDKHHGACRSMNINLKQIKSKDDELTVHIKLPDAKRPKLANKQENKTVMTITAVLEPSLPAIKPEVKITKNKPGSMSINGISIKRRYTLEAKLTPNMTNEDNQQNGPAASAEIVKYQCTHCYGNHWVERFNTPRDVYSHWLSSHANPSNLMPFKYSVIDFYACYHCQTIGTYFELIKHHKDCHHIKPFAIVTIGNNKKCALCQYVAPNIGVGMIAHFDAMHKIVLKKQSTRTLRCGSTPRRLSNSTIEQRLMVRECKRMKCGDCKMLFDSEYQIREHHLKNHRNSNLLVKEFLDSRSAYCICAECDCVVDRRFYMSHIEQHAFNFKCVPCKFHTNDFLQLVAHDKTVHTWKNTFDYRCLQMKNRLTGIFLKTTVIFANGIVLTKRNLLGTDYDDSKQLNVFIDNFIRVKREQYSRKT